MNFFPVHRRLTAAALMGFGVVGAGHAQNTVKARIYAELQQKQYTSAEQDAVEALHGQPGDCTIMVMHGMALEGQNRIDAAMQAMRAEVAACPRFIPGLEKASEIAYNRHLDDAESLLGKLVSEAPANRTGQAMLASLEARQGRCAEAVEHYALAGDAVLHNAAAVNQEAACLRALDQPVKAAGLLTERLASAPEDDLARRQLAAVQAEQGKSADALATLGPLIEPASTDDRALLLAAQIAEKQNRTPEAIALLRRAIAAAPKRVENYLYAADVCFAHGSAPVGIDLLNLGLTQVPDNARMLLARGVLEVQESKTEDALRDFSAAHRTDPSLTFAQDALGMLLSQGHEQQAATRMFAETLKKQPDDPLLNYLYAESLSQGSAEDKRTRADALASARKAVRLEPGYQPAHDLLCTLLMREGDLPGVLHEAQAALAIDPNDESALYEELLAERKLKHAPEADGLVKRLQEARAHNRQTVTKYVLADGQAP